MNPPPPPILPGLAPIAERYDGFLVDLWGVIHDGHTPYPGATDALRRLKDAGKTVILLSNSSQRATAIERLMTDIGIERGLYDAVLSSGEVAWKLLKERRDPWHAALGHRCLYLGPAYKHSLLEELEIETVPDVEAAEFVLVTGPGGDGETSVAPYEDALARAAARGLPMVCPNPDLEVIHKGRRQICAGALAARYEALGGTVAYHGKPHPGIYRRALEMLGIADAGRVLAVGDTLRTDVAGGRGAGTGTALVAGGVHAETLGVRPGESPAAERVAALCAAEGIRPDVVLPAFRW